MVPGVAVQVLELGQEKQHGLVRQVSALVPGKEHLYGRHTSYHKQEADAARSVAEELGGLVGASAGEVHGVKQLGLAEVAEGQVLGPGIADQ